MPYYQLSSTNSEHQAPDKPEQTPTVFLDLKNYPDRKTLNLNGEPDPQQLETLAPEIAPVLRLLSAINALDETSLNDKAQLAAIFEGEFDNSMISNFRLPMFRLEQGVYGNASQRIQRYATTASRWESIVPVGYLDQGEIRYVFFYPITDFHPLDANGEGIVQVLPTVQIDGEYKLGFNGLLFSYVSPIRLPQAIMLLMEHFDRDNPPPPPVEPESSIPEAESGSSSEPAVHHLSP